MIQVLLLLVPRDAVILPAVVILPPLTAPVAVRYDAVIALTTVNLLALNEDEAVMLDCFVLAI